MHKAGRLMVSVLHPQSDSDVFTRGERLKCRRCHKWCDVLTYGQAA